MTVEVKNMPLTEKTENVAVAFDWLKDIVPTSVEAERIFSTVGNFVAKLRSRMNDDTVDALIILKTLGPKGPSYLQIALEEPKGPTLPYWFTASNT